MSTAKKQYKRVTVKSLTEMKGNKEKISMLTAYDYTMAKIIDSAGIDVILVGDSASNVMAGHETTLPITLDQMIYHGHSVKLEGGSEVKESIKRILNAGIPVMGHLGLTPQSIYKFGTYTVRAKEQEEADKLIQDAISMERYGCFALVLEKVPAALAKQVADQLTIPVIGIGAGAGVDGQVLVSHDMFGMTHEFNPRFLRRYLNLYEDMGNAVSNYVKDVKAMDFPNDDEQY
jgi:3-methyl-2-oxobutanoate hydroxymethyltransferase